MGIRLASTAAVGAIALAALLPASAANAATGPVSVGTAPTSIAVDTGNHRVVVGNGVDGTVSIFDGSLPTPVVSTLKFNTKVAGVAVDIVAHLAFVTLTDIGEVGVIDIGAAVPGILRTVKVGLMPSTVGVDPIYHAVFVVNTGSSTVSRFIGTDGVPTPQTIMVGASPSGVAVDYTSHAVFVSSSSTNSVARFDSASMTPSVSTITGVTNAGALAVDLSSEQVFAVNAMGGELLRFSALTTTPTFDRIVVSGIPVSVVVDPQTHEVYVAAQGSNQFMNFDGDFDGVPPVVSTTTVGSEPTAITFDQDVAVRTVYVANRGDGTVSRLDGVAVSFPVFTSGAPPVATVGMPYSFNFTATGRPRPTYSSTLPVGGPLSLSAAGVLSGVPTEAGSISFAVLAKNAGETVRLQVKLQVEPAPTPTSTPSPAVTSTSVPSPGASTGAAGGAGTGAGSRSGTGSGPSTSYGGQRGLLAQTGAPTLEIALGGGGALILLTVGGVLLTRPRTRRP